MTTLFDIGDTIKLVGTFTDDADVVQDPTAVFLTVLEPDGTSTSYEYPATITKESTGVYYVEFDITQSGAHFYRFYSTGTGKAAGQRLFNVRILQA